MSVKSSNPTPRFTAHLYATKQGGEMNHLNATRFAGRPSIQEVPVRGHEACKYADHGLSSPELFPGRAPKLAGALR